MIWHVTLSLFQFFQWLLITQRMQNNTSVLWAPQMYDIRAPGAEALSQDGLSFCFVKRTVVLGSCHKMDCLIALWRGRRCWGLVSYCFVKRTVVLGPCHKMDCLIALWRGRRCWGLVSYCFVKRTVVLGPCHKMDCLIALSCPQQLFVWTLFLWLFPTAWLKH